MPIKLVYFENMYCTLVLEMINLSFSFFSMVQLVPVKIISSNYTYQSYSRHLNLMMNSIAAELVHR